MKLIAVVLAVALAGLVAAATGWFIGGLLRLGLVSLGVEFHPTRVSC